MTTEQPNQRADIAVAILLWSTSFFAGAAPAALVLILFTEWSFVGWIVILAIASNFAFVWFIQLFERPKKPNVAAAKFRSPMAWYRRNAIILGFLSGFVFTFVAAGKQLEII